MDSIEFPGLAKPDLEMESIDEIDFLRIESEIEYIEDFEIDIDENSFVNQLIKRNILI